MSLPTALALSCLGCLLGSATGNFVSPGLGKCLDIEAKLKEDGKTRQTEEDMKATTDPINVQLYACHEQHNQNWIIVDGQIKSESLDRCLTVNGTAAANSNVVLLECSDDQAALQKWELTAYGYVQSAGTKVCLDVKAEAKDDGSFEKFDEIKTHKVVNVQLYDCHEPDTDRVNQLWEWAPYSGDAVVSAFELRGSSVLRSASTGNLSLALAATGMVGLFAAGIFVGLRARRAAALVAPSTRVVLRCVFVGSRVSCVCVCVYGCVFVLSLNERYNGKYDEK
jgi:hypothetical protein